MGLSPLRQLALSIYCDLAHAGEAAHRELWRHDGLALYLRLLQAPPHPTPLPSLVPSTNPRPPLAVASPVRLDERLLSESVVSPGRPAESSPGRSSLRVLSPVRLSESVVCPSRSSV